MINELVEKLIDLESLDHIIDRSSVRTGCRSIFARVRDELGITAQIEQDCFESIPTQGPLIVVANHPTGFAEGVAVPALLDSVRQDVFVLGHRFFERWPSLAERMVLVDPQASRDAGCANNGGFFDAVRRLRQGGCLVMFPAGTVARPTSLDLRSREGEWRSGLAKLVRLSGASVLPVHVTGSCSLFYRFASLVHPRLGVPLLCREATLASRHPMEISLRALISPEEFKGFGDPAAASARVRSLLLESKAS